MTRILVCPTAFKGTLTAEEASRAMAGGARAALPDARVIRRPLSDGGPGLLDAMRFAGDVEGDAWRDPGAGEAHPSGARLDELTVTGPLGDPVRGRILWTPGPDGPIATIESADACGLALMPRERRDPMRSDTRGVGELIRHAEEEGATEIRVGLGGSGTVDGGTGAAHVFGWRFLDSGGRDLSPGGGTLRRLARIEPGHRPKVSLTALCDVDHPLLGPDGAARTFAPQKGAAPDEVQSLEAGLERLAARIGAQFGLEVGDLAGGGAAGGLGAGLAAFLGAALEGGSAWVLERVGFPEELERSDLVVTGEGAYDATSLAGKVVGRVLDAAREAGVTALLVCGRVEEEPPVGVRAVDAGGARLDASGLAELTSRLVATVTEA